MVNGDRIGIAQAMKDLEVEKRRWVRGVKDEALKDHAAKGKGPPGRKVVDSAVPSVLLGHNPTRALNEYYEGIYEQQSP